MARYRLRFLLQEFDLPKGATLLGRGADCQVTIADPLVSRQHARIVIREGDDAIVEDLGSRNGVKVNGVTHRGSVRLRDGDRLRIGTQELVFCRADVEPEPHFGLQAKTTGFLRYCAKCRLPHPQELAVCPACGSTEQVDEERGGAPLDSSAQHAWNLQLAIEVTQKALASNRLGDAMRMLQRARTQVEERIAAGAEVDPVRVDELARVSVEVARLTDDPVWIAWLLRFFAERRWMPPGFLVDAAAEFAPRRPLELAPVLEMLVASLRPAPRVDLVASGDDGNSASRPTIPTEPPGEVTSASAVPPTFALGTPASPAGIHGEPNGPRATRATVESIAVLARETVERARHAEELDRTNPAITG